jgi:hypothetical protein
MAWNRALTLCVGCRRKTFCELAVAPKTPDFEVRRAPHFDNFQGGEPSKFWRRADPNCKKCFLTQAPARSGHLPARELTVSPAPRLCESPAARRAAWSILRLKTTQVRYSLFQSLAAFSCFRRKGTFLFLFCFVENFPNPSCERLISLSLPANTRRYSQRHHEERCWNHPREAVSSTRNAQLSFVTAPRNNCRRPPRLILEKITRFESSAAAGRPQVFSCQKRLDTCAV